MEAVLALPNHESHESEYLFPEIRRVSAREGLYARARSGVWWDLRHGLRITGFERGSRCSSMSDLQDAWKIPRSWHGTCLAPSLVIRNSHHGDGSNELL